MRDPASPFRSETKHAPAFEPGRMARRHHAVQSPTAWCLDPGSNRGPLPLQGSALPTELSKRARQYQNAPKAYSDIRRASVRQALKGLIQASVRLRLSYHAQFAFSIALIDPYIGYKAPASPSLQLLPAPPGACQDTVRGTSPRDRTSRQ